MPRPYLRLLRQSPLLGCAATLLCACQSASEHAADADKASYAIVDAVRAGLGATDTLRLGGDGPDLRSRLLESSSSDGDGSELSAALAEVRAMSLVDCLRIAAENSRDFQDRRESLYLTALSLTRTQWDFGFQEVGDANAFVGGDDEAARGAGEGASFSISRLFLSGARLVGSVALSVTKDLSRGDAWSAVSDLSLGLTQPLWRGFGRDIVREPLTQAERDVVYEARRFERFRRTFAFDVASRYYRIVESMNLLRNERANRDSLVTLRERNEAFARAGRLSDIQVDQARQDEFRAENRVIDARRNLEASLDSFKLFLGLPVEVEVAVDPRAEDPLLSLIDELNLELEEDLAIAVGLAERLDNRTVIEAAEDAERRAHIAADALRLGLDLSADVSVSSEENALVDFRGKNLAWNAALDVSLPIDLIPERNAYRQALITLDASRRAVEESRDVVIADVRDAQRQLDAARATLVIQERAVTLAERRVESASLSLEAGRASTRDLLEAQEDLLLAQNDYARLRTDFALAALALYRDMELLRVEDGLISVDDGALTEAMARREQQGSQGAPNSRGIAPREGASIDE